MLIRDGRLFSNWLSKAKDMSLSKMHTRFPLKQKDFQRISMKTKAIPANDVRISKSELLLDLKVKLIWGGQLFKRGCIIEHSWCVLEKIGSKCLLFLKQYTKLEQPNLICFSLLVRTINSEVALASWPNPVGRWCQKLNEVGVWAPAAVASQPGSRLD